MKKLLFVFGFILVFYAFTPPGTLKVDTAFYFDQSEISNESWAEYINYLKDWRQSDKESINAALPDSVIWQSVYHGFFTKNWNKNQNYPVVGVSYTQAVNFCKWRSEAVRIKYGKKVKYRLPTQEEWVKFANAHTPKESGSSILDNLQTVGNNTASKKDVFHLADNISEMTSERGVAMGNNFTDKQKGVNAHAYTKPERWLGFRCVCEVVK